MGVMELFIQYLILLANFSKNVISPDILVLAKNLRTSDFACHIVKISVVWLMENI